jgi:hypothetical protein
MESKDNFNSFFRAQGTIEYLLIVGVVIVVSLFVVGILTDFLSQGSQLNPGSSKLYWQSQELAVIDSAQDGNGKLLLVLMNNSVENIVINSIVANGVIYDTGGVEISSQSKKPIYLNKPNTNLANSNAAEITFNYTSSLGLEKNLVGEIPLVTTITPVITPSSTTEVLVKENCFDWNSSAGFIHPICTCEDLDTIDYNSTTLTWNYSLQNNLNFTNCDSSYTTGEGWRPIGDNSTASTATRFGGTFRGNGFIIKNLYINRPDSNYVGLFGYVTANTKDINDLGLVDANVIGFYNVGGISGYYGRINNSYLSGSVVGAMYVGGLNGGYAAVNNSYNLGDVNGSYVGGISGSNATINKSYNSGSVTRIGSTGRVGGLIGYSGTVNNSYNLGTVTGGSSYTGGIIGIYGTVNNSYNLGNVIGSNYVGGVIGYGGSVINSYNLADVSGGTQVGGILGRLTAGTTAINSFTKGTIKGTSSTYGAIGYVSGGVIANIYWYDSNSLDNAGACIHIGDGNCTRLYDNNYSILFDSSTDIYDTNVPFWTFGSDKNWTIRNGDYPLLSWQVQ